MANINISRGSGLDTRFAPALSQGIDARLPLAALAPGNLIANTPNPITGLRQGLLEGYNIARQRKLDELTARKMELAQQAQAQAAERADLANVIALGTFQEAQRKARMPRWTQVNITDENGWTQPTWVDANAPNDTTMYVPAGARIPPKTEAARDPVSGKPVFGTEADKALGKVIPAEKPEAGDPVDFFKAPDGSVRSGRKSTLGQVPGEVPYAVTKPGDADKLVLGYKDGKYAWVTKHDYTVGGYSPPPSAAVAGKSTMTPLQKANALATVDSFLKSIDDTASDPVLDTATGVTSGVRYIPGTPWWTFDTRLSQLKGKSFLQAYETLRGAGQITEVEGQKATDAMARLSPWQDPKEFRKGLKELREIVQGGRDRLEKFGGAPPSTGVGGTQGSSVEGTPKVSPGEPGSRERPIPVDSIDDPRLLDLDKDTFVVTPDGQVRRKKTDRKSPND